MISADQLLEDSGSILYDCEIVSMIPQKMELRDSNLFYCNGWDDYEGMGISVVCVYDFVDKCYKVFMQDNLDDLRLLIESRNIIIGYNNRHFDDKILAANGIDVPKEKSYDIWKQIADTQTAGNRSGFSLNNMLIANKLPLKTGEGGEAPKLAQRGQWGKLISYCLDDTRLSVLLLRLACNDCMINPKTGSFLSIKKPYEIITIEPGESLFG